mgnify:CR=1 FL=1
MIVSGIALIDIFFLMIRRPPRSTLDRSSAASDVYKRQGVGVAFVAIIIFDFTYANLCKALSDFFKLREMQGCLLYTSPSPRDRTRYRMPSSA